MKNLKQLNHVVQWFTFVKTTLRTRNEASERYGLFEMMEINSFRWHHIITSHIDLQYFDQLFPKVSLSFWTVPRAAPCLSLSSAHYSGTVSPDIASLLLEYPQGKWPGIVLLL